MMRTVQLDKVAPAHKPRIPETGREEPETVSHCLPPAVPEFYPEAATRVKSGFLAVPQKTLSGKPM